MATLVIYIGGILLALGVLVLGLYLYGRGRAGSRIDQQLRKPYQPRSVQSPDRPHADVR